MALTLKKIGPGASLQDRGRLGWQRYGVSASGPMDWVAAQIANRIVGNDPGLAAIELDQSGGVAHAKADCLIGVCAPNGSAALNGDEIMPTARLNLTAGDEVTIAPAKQGGWAYLAIAGGFAGHDQLGSVSLHRRAGLGGPPLAPGTTLRPNNPVGQSSMGPACFPLVDQAYNNKPPLRLIMGPQDDRLTADSVTRFCAGEFRLSAQCDRMGYRLTGPALQHKDGADIVSDGIAMGTIQVPGDGQPIILMADRQTSGGYPKLGSVITADLPRLAQHALGPKSKPLIFQAITPSAAIDHLRSVIAVIDRAINTPHPLGPRSLTTDILLRENLIDGAISDT